MAGHNKWSKIKHKKSAEDAKKSKLFSMLVKSITVESRKVGGDKNHPSLKAIIDRAKAANMPNDNIERAVQKGVSSESDSLEKVTYEIYAPGGVAIIADGITDNKNRTTAEIKHLLSKNNGNLGTQGSTAWAFVKTSEGWQAEVLVPVADTDAEQVNQLIESLSDHDDIDAVYSNADLSWEYSG